MDLWQACTKCSYDLGGLYRAWEKSCPLNVRCPECGTSLECAELRRLVTRGPVWSFETRKRATLIRFCATLGRVLTLHPSLNLIRSSHPFRPLRLLVLIAVVWLVLIGPLHMLAVQRMVSLNDHDRVVLSPQPPPRYSMRLDDYYRSRLRRDLAALPWWPFPSTLNWEVKPISFTAPGSTTPFRTVPAPVLLPKGSISVREFFFVLYALPGVLSVALALSVVVQRGRAWLAPFIRMAVYSFVFAVFIGGVTLWIGVGCTFARLPSWGAVLAAIMLVGVAGLCIAWWRHLNSQTRAGRVGASVIVAALIVGGIASLSLLA